MIFTIFVFVASTKTPRDGPLPTRDAGKKRWRRAGNPLDTKSGNRRQEKRSALTFNEYYYKSRGEKLILEERPWPKG